MYSFSKLYITLTLVFPYHINCDLQHSHFSNSGEEDLTGWTYDAIFDRHNYSRVRCAILCLEDQCCEQFLYSASTRRCIGLHFMNFYSSSFVNSVSAMYEGMTAYQKGLALVKFDLQGVSLVHCGSLCSEDECCKEVLYNATSGRCIGSPFSDLKSTLNNLVEASYDGMSKYQKGCESGWLKFNGHCFLHVLDLVAWYDAKLVCKKKCSYLVEINSLEESKWLASTFLDKVTCGADEFFSCTSWIGGNDMNVEGSYVWDHSNTSLVYTNWHPQEPSLLHPSDASTRDCIDLLRSGRWNDRPCLYSNTFICEKKIGD